MRLKTTFRKSQINHNSVVIKMKDLSSYEMNLQNLRQLTPVSNCLKRGAPGIEKMRLA